MGALVGETVGISVGEVDGVSVGHDPQMPNKSASCTHCVCEKVERSISVDLTPGVSPQNHTTPALTGKQTSTFSVSVAPRKQNTTPETPAAASHEISGSQPSTSASVGDAVGLADVGMAVGLDVGAAVTGC